MQSSLASWSIEGLDRRMPKNTGPVHKGRPRAAAALRWPLFDHTLRLRRAVHEFALSVPFHGPKAFTPRGVCPEFRTRSRCLPSSRERNVGPVTMTMHDPYGSFEPRFRRKPEPACTGGMVISFPKPHPMPFTTFLGVQSAPLPVTAPAQAGFSTPPRSERYAAFAVPCRRPFRDQ